jgi:hypothetical protein
MKKKVASIFLILRQTETTCDYNDYSLRPKIDSHMIFKIYLTIKILLIF